jgi:hypothetical protein
MYSSLFNISNAEMKSYPKKERQKIEIEAKENPVHIYVLYVYGNV